MHFSSPRPTSRFLQYLPFLLILMAVPLISASSTLDTGRAEATSKLEVQVREWVSALSVQQAFSQWKNAAVEIQALGPGTHGWLAIVKNGEEPVGYLVIHAVEDGTFRLGEYGSGPDILFSKVTLQRTLTENGLISSEQDPYAAVSHYFHPFAALWEVTVGPDSYWVDAKTGEILPIERKIWQKLLPQLQAEADQQGTSGDAASVESAALSEPFDPYGQLPWLTSEPPLSVQDGAKVQHRIRSGLHLRYVTEPYGDAALYALAVTGYQSWSGGRLDLALDMEGNRFIPLDTLKRLGRFYG